MATQAPEVPAIQPDEIVSPEQLAVDEEEAGEIDETREVAAGLIEEAHALEVDSKEDYHRAGELLKRIKSAEKAIEAAFEPIRKRTHGAWKATLRQRDRLTDPLEAAEQELKGAVAAFKEEVERRRRERKRKEREQKREKARDRLEARIEEALEAERYDKAEQLMDQMDNPPEHLIDQIEDEAGDDEGDDPPAETDDGEVPVEGSLDADGIQHRSRWVAELEEPTDDAIRALCRAVADGEVPPSFVEANLSAIREAARTMDGQLTVPGVEIVQKISTAVYTD